MSSPLSQSASTHSTAWSIARRLWLSASTKGSLWAVRPPNMRPRGRTTAAGADVVSANSATAVNRAMYLHEHAAHQGDRDILVSRQRPADKPCGVDRCPMKRGRRTKVTDFVLNPLRRLAERAARVVVARGRAQERHQRVASRARVHARDDDAVAGPFDAERACRVLKRCRRR